jgi:Ca2+-binding EF-hand superfamily protein
MNPTDRQHYLNRLSLILLVLTLPISLLPHANADDGGKVYSVYDTDKNGYLEKIEYKKFYESKQKRSKNLDTWEFNNVDSNSDEKISEQEMVNALMKNYKRKNK